MTTTSSTLPAKTAKKKELINIENILSMFQKPLAYKGLYGFHKYWGKKPVECLTLLIQAFSKKGDLVVDPFLGSGIIAREAVDLGRRFIGCDINPIAIELSSLMLSVPNGLEFDQAYKKIEENVRTKIEESYLTSDNEVATHYLWNENNIDSVWVMKRGNGRKVMKPNEHDIQLLAKFCQYTPKNLREIKLFDNSRINAKPHLTINDFFTGRALHNIDLLLDEINAMEDSNLKRSLLLCLTSGIGQMSKMVFAIKGRGKTTGIVSNKIEVGSWVIGLWRPKEHFEINVWNCFSNKAKILSKALISFNEANYSLLDSVQDVLRGNAPVAIKQMDAIEVMNQLDNSSVQLLVTDPPHSDRMPYLELSEIWNAIIKKVGDYEKEIVISNAKERTKNTKNYTDVMRNFFDLSAEKMCDGGIIAFMYNSTDDESWEALELKGHPSIRYVGCFPMKYSANSVVQDNRANSMKSDYVLIYQKGDQIKASDLFDLALLPEWTNQFPC